MIKQKQNIKITSLKNFIKRYDTTKIQDIEKQIKSHEWLSQLVEDQLKNKTDLSFGESYEKRKSKNKFPYNTTSQRKRKLLPLTPEERLKELPSIYQLVPVDPYNKTESTKEIFSNIIGRIPPEIYKKIKIDFDKSNNINISETTYDSDDDDFADN